MAAMVAQIGWRHQLLINRDALPSASTIHPQPCRGQRLASQWWTLLSAEPSVTTCVGIGMERTNASMYAVGPASG